MFVQVKVFVQIMFALKRFVQVMFADKKNVFVEVMLVQISWFF